MAYAGKKTSYSEPLNEKATTQQSPAFLDQRASTAVQLKQQQLMTMATDQSPLALIQRVKIHNVPKTSDQLLSPSDMNPTNQSVVCGVRITYYNRLTAANVNKEYLGKSFSGQGKHAEDWAKKMIKRWIDASLLSGALAANDTITAKLNVNKSMCSGARGPKLATFSPTVTKHSSCTDTLSNFNAHNNVNVNLAIRIMRVYKHTEKRKASRAAITHLKSRPHVILKPWKLKNTTTGARKAYINAAYQGPTAAAIRDSVTHQGIINLC